MSIKDYYSYFIL